MGVNKLIPRLVLAGLVPVFMGCYTYADASLETLSPGTQTRVMLDADGFGRVVNQAAMNGVPMENLDLGGQGISGRLVSLDPNNMMVELRGIGGSVYSADIPMHSVQGVAVRTFSPRRTILAVGLGAVIAGGVYSGTVGGTTSAGVPDPGDNMIVPIFSFPLR